jgi:hypothetical protein
MIHTHRISRLLSIFFFPFVLGSCGLDSSTTRKARLEKLFKDIHLDTTVIGKSWDIKSEPPERILIENGRHTELNLDKSIDSVYYVPLETNKKCLIGKIDKIYEDESHIVVVDKEFAKEVFIFDNKGKFLAKASGFGDGPRQYGRISDASVDFVCRQVTVMDEVRRKLLYYGFDGQFIKAAPIPFYFNFLEYGNGDTTMTWANLNVINSHIPAIENYGLFQASRTGQVLHKAFPFDTRQTGNNYSNASLKVLSRSGSGVYYNPRMSDYIFKVDSDKISPLYYLDMQGKSFTDEEFADLTDDIYNKRLKETDFFMFNGDYAINDDFVYCKILNKVKFFGCFYNRNLKKGINFAMVQADHPRTILFTFPQTGYKNYFISILNAPDMASLQKKLKLFRKDPLVIDLYQKVRPGDNPVLMYYSFKKNMQ